MNFVRHLFFKNLKLIIKILFFCRPSSDQIVTLQNDISKLNEQTLHLQKTNKEEVEKIKGESKSVVDQLNSEIARYNMCSFIFIASCTVTLYYL